MKKNLKKVYSVVSCFVEYNKKILILQRAKKDCQYGLWGIPGGKLEPMEEPINGLARELQEELKLEVNKDDIQFLNSLPLQNNCDGNYFLYIYFLKLDCPPSININLEEHLNYNWTTLEQLENYPLLFCQGTAFKSVEKKLKRKILQQEKALCLSSTT